jgi:hypothetical protein
MIATQHQELLALAKVDQKRLERLAVLAGRSPRSMLKFVLRDGFEAVEQDIRETLAAERDIASHGTVAHAEVMRSAAAIVGAARGRRLGKAA